MDEHNLPPKPDWTISELYNKSWKIVKNNPVLWIFGLAVAAGVGLNFSNVDRIFDSDTKNSLPATPSFQNFTNGQSDALGISATAPWTNFLSQIPTWIWVTLGIELVAFVIFALAISIVSSAWANGSLISGIDAALEGKKPTIRESSEKSFKSIKSLAWLTVVPGLVLTLVASLVLGTLAAFTAFVPSAVKVILIIVIILLGLVTYYFAIYITLSRIWALRMVVLDGKGGKEALFAGYRVAKKKTWSMIGLGLVNTIASIMVALVPIAILGLLFFGGFAFAKSVTVLSTILITLAITFGILAVIVLMLLGGIITSFKASTWTIAYKRMRNKYAS